MLPGPTIKTRVSKGAFTLVELLIVIAIIALLVGLLLPAARKARMEAWKAVSLVNVRSLAQAGSAYQNDQRGYLPITPFGVPVVNWSGGFCTWSAWGKYCSDVWAGSANMPDPRYVLPSARPLNPYLTSESLPSVLDQSRKIWQLPGCKDPSDKVGHQRGSGAWSGGSSPPPANPDGLSCYEDVGTSYQWQAKWYFPLARISDPVNAFRLGMDRFRLADQYQPSRMLWANDEWADITINTTSASVRVVNGYGDINRSVAAFLDGHAKYVRVLPGGDSDANALDRPWLVPAYCNADYTVVFPDLRR